MSKKTKVARGSGILGAIFALMSVVGIVRPEIPLALGALSEAASAIYDAVGKEDKAERIRDAAFGKEGY